MKPAQQVRCSGCSHRLVDNASILGLAAFVFIDHNIVSMKLISALIVAVRFGSGGGRVQASTTSYTSTSALSWSPPPPLNFVFITTEKKNQNTRFSNNRSSRIPLTYKMPPATESSVHSPKEIQRLNDVIDSTTPARLRALLKDLSEETPENWEFVRIELMLQPGALKRAWAEKDEDDECEGSGLAESDYSDDHNEAPASRQRFEICD